MPEFDNIVPNNVRELEPAGGISVVRYRVLAYDMNGVPVTQVSQASYFYELKRSLEWATEAPNHLHQYKIPLPGASLRGILTHDPETAMDFLTLSTGERSGISPRTVKNLYTALSDDKTFLNIFIHLDTKETTKFCTNMVWIGLPNPSDKPTLNFSFNPGNYSVDNLADAMTVMLKRVNFVTDKLLNGISDNSGPNVRPI